MPTVMKSTGSFSFAELRDYHGDTNPVSLFEFYAGGEYSRLDQGIPSSGLISISNFFGKETRYLTVLYYSASSSFTVPANITRIFAIVVGGGGSSGISLYNPANDPNTPPTRLAYGGYGGYGGLAMVYQAVSPGAVLSVTVGGHNGSSIFNGITATPGGLGGNGYSTGGGDIPFTYWTGATGTNGSSSGTNYIAAPAIGTNITSATWVSELNLLNPRYVGTVNASNRSSLVTVRNQVVSRVTGAAWSSSGSLRPGMGAPLPPSTVRVAGTYGAVVICY